MSVLSLPLLPALLVSLCAVLLAAPAHAGGDIIKCVDAEGHVTLTDGACDSGVATMLVAATAPMAPGQRATAAIERVAVHAGAVGPAVSAPAAARERASTARPRLMLAGDVATLRAARSSLRALDDAAASMRQQRLAGLN